MNPSQVRLIVFAILTSAVALGCDARTPPPSPVARKAPAAVPAPAAQPASPSPAAASQRQAPPQSPVTCALSLGKYHVRRDYARLAPLIHADHREATLAFLVAVDGVLDANARLRRAAIDRFGRVMADAWDLSAIENNLGVFSADTRVIGQRFRGDEAEVTLQEGEQIPLVRARFVRTDGEWQFVPDAAPPDIQADLTRLGEALSALAARVEGGADYMEYVDAFPERIAPLIAAVAKSNPPDKTASAGPDDVSP